MFHEQIYDEFDKGNEELDIPLLVEGSEEVGDNHEKQKKAEVESSDTTIEASHSKEIQNKLEDIPTLRG